ncbi:hypothetical protein ACIGW1_05075 [Streptomyces sp. NPDC053780]|uniref:hypothetical protein n=1 Tax=unclassified Streptomyces TaxID=2593676 RepID=UPI003437BCE9
MVTSVLRGPAAALLAVLFITGVHARPAAETLTVGEAVTRLTVATESAGGCPEQSVTHEPVA